MYTSCYSLDEIYQIQNGSTLFHIKSMYDNRGFCKISFYFTIIIICNNVDHCFMFQLNSFFAERKIIIKSFVSSIFMYCIVLSIMLFSNIGGWDNVFQKSSCLMRILISSTCRNWMWTIFLKYEKNHSLAKTYFFL